MNATRTLKLASVTRGLDESKSTSVAALVSGLIEDSPIPVKVDTRRQWREFTDQTLDTLDEALECFERTPKNSTCTIRLNRLIQEDNVTLNHLYDQVDGLSPIKQRVLIDMIPHVGGTAGQLWLAELLREAITVDLDAPDQQENVRHRIMRALTVSHQLQAPVVEVIEVLWELSMTNSSLGQAGQLALGTLSRRLSHNDSNAVFLNLSSRLEWMRQSEASVANLEATNTLLRALGNQGDKRLVDLLSVGYHTHDCVSLREAAAHVLRRVPTAEAEERLLWVLRNDPNHTAQATAVLALQHSERNNSRLVVESIQDMLISETYIDPALQERLMKHLISEAPHMVDECRMAREDAKRRQLAEDGEVLGQCICGACGGCAASCIATAADDSTNAALCDAVTDLDDDTACLAVELGGLAGAGSACTYNPADRQLPPEGEMCLDGSEPVPCVTPADIVTTLVDVYIGKSLEFGAGAGHPDMGIQFNALSKNFARLRISVFGGEFEINLLTDVGVDVHCLGHRLELVQGVVAFNAGMSYKNTLASQLASMLNTGGKYVKIAMDAERLVQLGMQKGLVFVGEKVEKVAMQVDFVIDKVELVQNITHAFAHADDFVNQTIDLIISKVTPVIEMAAGPESPLKSIGDGVTTFVDTVSDIRHRAEPLVELLESASAVTALVDDFMVSGDIATISTVAVDTLQDELPELIQSLNVAQELQEAASIVKRLSGSFEDAFDAMETVIGVVETGSSGPVLTQIQEQLTQFDNLDTVLSSLHATAVDSDSGNDGRRRLQPAAADLSALHGMDVSNMQYSLADASSVIGPVLAQLDTIREQAATLGGAADKLVEIKQKLEEMQEKIDSAQEKVEKLQGIQAKVDTALAKAQQLLNVTGHVEWGVAKVMTVAQSAAQKCVYKMIGEERANWLAHIFDLGNRRMLAVTEGSCDRGPDGQIHHARHCEMRSNMHYHRRQLERRELMEIDQVTRLFESMMNVEELGETLAEKAEQVIMPVCTLLLRQMDNMDEFLNGTIGEAARVGKVQLPAFRSKVEDFYLYFKMFVGVVKDLAATAEKASGGMEELADMQVFLDNTTAISEEWMGKIDNWMDIAEKILDTMENMDSTVLLEMVQQLLQNLNLPGEGIVKAFEEVILMINAVQDIMENPDGDSTDKMRALADVLRISADKIAPGAMERMQNTVTNIADNAVSAIPDGVVEVFVETHQSLCDPGAAELLLCTPLVEQPTGVSGMLSMGGELGAVLKFTINTGSDLDQLRTFGTLIGAAADAQGAVAAGRRRRAQGSPVGLKAMADMAVGVLGSAQDIAEGALLPVLRMIRQELDHSVPSESNNTAPSEPSADADPLATFVELKDLAIEVADLFNRNIISAEASCTGTPDPSLVESPDCMATFAAAPDELADSCPLGCDYVAPPTASERAMIMANVLAIAADAAGQLAQQMTGDDAEDPSAVEDGLPANPGGCDLREGGLQAVICMINLAHDTAQEAVEGPLISIVLDIDAQLQQVQASEISAATGRRQLSTEPQDPQSIGEIIGTLTGTVRRMQSALEDTDDAAQKQNLMVALIGPVMDQALPPEMLDDSLGEMLGSIGALSQIQPILEKTIPILQSVHAALGGAEDMRGGEPPLGLGEMVTLAQDLVELVSEVIINGSSEDRLQAAPRLIAAMLDAYEIAGGQPSSTGDALMTATEILQQLAAIPDFGPLLAIADAYDARPPAGTTISGVESMGSILSIVTQIGSNTDIKAVAGVADSLSAYAELGNVGRRRAQTNSAAVNGVAVELVSVMQQVEDIDNSKAQVVSTLNAVYQTVQGLACQEGHGLGDDVCSITPLTEQSDIAAISRMAFGIADASAGFAASGTQLDAIQGALVVAAMLDQANGNTVATDCVGVITDLQFLAADTAAVAASLEQMHALACGDRSCPPLGLAAALQGPNKLQALLDAMLRVGQDFSQSLTLAAEADPEIALMRLLGSGIGSELETLSRYSVDDTEPAPNAAEVLPILVHLDATLGGASQLSAAEVVALLTSGTPGEAATVFRSISERALSSFAANPISNERWSTPVDPFAVARMAQFLGVCLDSTTAATRATSETGNILDLINQAATAFTAATVDVMPLFEQIGSGLGSDIVSDGSLDGNLAVVVSLAASAESVFAGRRRLQTGSDSLGTAHVVAASYEALTGDSRAMEIIDLLSRAEATVVAITQENIPLVRSLEGVRNTLLSESNTAISTEDVSVDTLFALVVDVKNGLEALQTRPPTEVADVSLTCVAVVCEELMGIELMHTIAQITDQVTAIEAAIPAPIVAMAQNIIVQLIANAESGVAGVGRRRVQLDESTMISMTALAADPSAFGSVAGLSMWAQGSMFAGMGDVMAGDGMPGEVDGTTGGLSGMMDLASNMGGMMDTMGSAMPGGSMTEMMGGGQMGDTFQKMQGYMEEAQNYVAIATPYMRRIVVGMRNEYNDESMCCRDKLLHVEWEGANFTVTEAMNVGQHILNFGKEVFENAKVTCGDRKLCKVLQGIRALRVILGAVPEIPAVILETIEAIMRWMEKVSDDHYPTMFKIHAALDEICVGAATISKCEDEGSTCASFPSHSCVPLDPNNLFDAEACADIVDLGGSAACDAVISEHRGETGSSDNSPACDYITWAACPEGCSGIPGNCTGSATCTLRDPAGHVGGAAGCGAGGCPYTRADCGNGGMIPEDCTYSAYGRGCPRLKACETNSTDISGMLCLPEPGTRDIGIDEFGSMLLDLGRAGQEMLSSSPKPIFQTLQVAKLIAVAVDAFGEDASAAVKVISTIEDAVKTVEDVVTDDTAVDISTTVHHVMTRDTTIVPDPGPRQFPVVNGTVQIDIDDIVNMVRDIVHHARQVLDPNDPMPGVLIIVARTIDSIEQLGGRVEAAVVAAVELRQMMKNGASAGGMMVVLEKVIFAVTGEPMTSETNPVTVQVKKAITGLMNSTGIDMERVRNLPQELEDLAVAQAMALVESSKLRPVMEKIEWAQGNISMVQNKSAKAKAVLAQAHEATQQAAEGIAVAQESIAAIESLQASIANADMGAAWPDVVDEGRRLQDSTAAIPQTISFQSLLQSDVTGFLDDFTSFTNVYMADPGTLQAVFSQVCSDPSEVCLRDEFAAKMDTLLPLLSTVRSSLRGAQGVIHALPLDSGPVQDSVALMTVVVEHRQSLRSGLEIINAIADYALMDADEQAVLLQELIPVLVENVMSAFGDLGDRLRPVRDAWSSSQAIESMVDMLPKILGKISKSHSFLPARPYIQ